MVLFYVVTRGNPVPVGDQWWDLVYIAVKTRAGILTPEDVFVYYLGHRPTVNHLIAAAFTLLTDYDVRLLRFVSVATTLGSLSVAALLLARRHRDLLPMALPLFSLVLFTLYQADTWLDAFQVTWQQPLLFILIGLLVLDRLASRVVAFAGVTICATVATFSHAMGLAAWFVLPVALFANQAYRQRYAAIGWFLAAMGCIGFYLSGYALNPHEAGTARIPVNMLRPGNWWRLLVYQTRFQAERFELGDTAGLAGPALVVLAMGLLIVNAWILIRGEYERETVATWGSLALFSLAAGGLAVLGRGVYIPIEDRYSPGGDGFWLASVVLALLVLRRSPVRSGVAVVNVALIAGVMALTIYKDTWFLRRSVDPFPDTCDQCVLEYPLTRDTCLLKCFEWAEEQSVYHLAALKLSVFNDVQPSTILPESSSPVVTDLPNRWLSVYARDYMLPGVDEERLYSLAPQEGAWAVPNRPFSPWYRGEWSTDFLPRPLVNAWLPADFAKGVADRFRSQRRLWYLNAPETSAHFGVIDKAFVRSGFRGYEIAIRSPRYSAARFALRCYERAASESCQAYR